MRDPLAGFQATGHALPQPGEDAIGSAADQEELRLAAGRHAEDPALDEVGAVRAHRPIASTAATADVHVAGLTPRRRPRGRARSSCSRCSVVDAGEEQPLPAAKAPDERVLQRAGIHLVAGNRARARSISRWLTASRRRSSSRVASAGPGTPGTTVGAPAGNRPCAARAAAVASPPRASKAWPSAWATSAPPRRRRARRRGRGARPGGRVGGADRDVLGHETAAAPSPARRRTSRRAGSGRPSSSTRNGATRSGALAARAASQAGRGVAASACGDASAKATAPAAGRPPRDGGSRATEPRASSPRLSWSARRRHPVSFAELDPRPLLRPRLSTRSRPGRPARAGAGGRPAGSDRRQPAADPDPRDPHRGPRGRAPPDLRPGLVHRGAGDPRRLHASPARRGCERRSTAAATPTSTPRS